MVHSEMPVEKVYREGITSITTLQIETARQAGYTVKLLAICERAGENGEGLVARVHPTLIPLDHPLIHRGCRADALPVERLTVAGVLPTRRCASRCTACRGLGEIRGSAENSCCAYG